MFTSMCNFSAYSCGIKCASQFTGVFVICGNCGTSVVESMQPFSEFPLTNTMTPGRESIIVQKDEEWCNVVLNHNTGENITVNGISTCKPFHVAQK